MWLAVCRAQPTRLEGLESDRDSPGCGRGGRRIADAVGRFKDTKEVDGSSPGCRSLSDSAPGMKGKLDKAVQSWGFIGQCVGVGGGGSGADVDAAKWGDENIPFIGWANLYTPDQDSSGRIRRSWILWWPTGGHAWWSGGAVRLPQGTRPRPISADVTHPGRAAAVHLRAGRPQVGHHPDLGVIG